MALYPPSQTHFNWTRSRPWTLGALAVFIGVQILALTPAPLESPSQALRLTEVELLEETLQGPARAPGIPTERIPEYTIAGFTYTSVSQGVKQWRLKADRAHMYNKEQIIHGIDVHAILYDSLGHETLVNGLEAKMVMGKKDLEIFGEVEAQMPDGFQTQSDYLLYRPEPREIHIPNAYRVMGWNSPAKDSPGEERMNFESFGLDYRFDTGVISLSSRVRTRHFLKGPKPQKTTILSDRAIIDRSRSHAWFTMAEASEVPKKFVKVEQLDLHSFSRKVTLSFEDQKVHQMVAEKDVTILDLSKPGMVGRRATGGMAEFDTRRDVVVLTDYPQVYQGEDTLVGDVILLHRESDLVEVENSNAYSSGKD